MIRENKRGIAVVAAFLALAGCGGGGGGSPTPAPPAPGADTTPDPFSFSEVTAARRGGTVTSAPVGISGINVATPVSITGGQYTVGGLAYTSSPGTLINNNAIVVRLTASTTPGGVAEAVVTVGGVSATFRVTTSTDVTPPTAAVVFPPPVTRTSGATITVRGTALDASGPLARVTVNGVAAVSTKGFATWTAEVPVAPGANTLTVTAEDGYLNVANAVATRSVTRNARLGGASAVALDEANGRAFVLDAAADSVFAIDLATGIRTRFSDTAIPNLRKDAVSLALVLDAAHNRLLVLDLFMEAIVAIDLATKQRTVLSGRYYTGGPRFEGPNDLALDPLRNRVLVTASGPPAVIAVDLDTGVRTVLSDVTTPGGGPMFSYGIASALDAAHNRLLVSDPTTTTIYAVDLSNGTRSVLSSNAVGPEPFDFVNAMGIDIAGNRVLVPQTNGRVLAVDLVSGQRSLFSAGSLVTYEAADLEVAGTRAIVVDQDALAAIDLASGAQALISPNNAVSGGVGLLLPSAMVLDLPNKRVLVADEALRAVVAIDLTTAVGTLLVDGSTGGAQFVAPRALALDAVGNRLFVLQGHTSAGPQPAIFAHDLTTGVRTVLSGPAQPNGNPPVLTTPQHMAIDAVGMRILVAERDARAVLAVGLTDGVRSIVSSDAQPDGVNAFATPLGLFVDSANGRALVASSALGAASRIMAMSLATGARTVIGENANAQMNGPKLLTLDSPRNRVLVADELRQTVVSVDLATQSVRDLSEANDPDNPISLPSGFAYDPATELAYVLDGHFGAVLVVDLVTGRRAYLSH